MRIAPVPKTGSVVRWSVGSSPIASANPDVAQRLAQAAYIHEVGGSNPSIGTIPDVDEWFSHQSDTLGSLNNVGSSPTVRTKYFLEIICC